MGVALVAGRRERASYFVGRQGTRPPADSGSTTTTTSGRRSWPRGAQPTVCRVMAVGSFAFGIAPVLIVATGRGAETWPVRVGAAAVTLCCLAAAWVWSRHGWSNRRQLQALSLAATAAATVVAAGDDDVRVHTEPALAVLVDV